MPNWLKEDPPTYAAIQKHLVVINFIFQVIAAINAKNIDGNLMLIGICLIWMLHTGSGLVSGRAVSRWQ